MNALIAIVIIMMILLSAGCISGYRDPGLKSLLNSTKSIVDDAKAFRLTDPASS